VVVHVHVGVVDHVDHRAVHADVPVAVAGDLRRRHGAFGDVGEAAHAAVADAHLAGVALGAVRLGDAADTRAGPVAHQVGPTVRPDRQVRVRRRTVRALVVRAQLAVHEHVGVVDDGGGGAAHADVLVAVACGGVRHQ